jgi:hypothetical protein
MILTPLHFRHPINGYTRTLKLSCICWYDFYFDLKYKKFIEKLNYIIRWKILTNLYLLKFRIYRLPYTIALKLWYKSYRLEKYFWNNLRKQK